MKILIACSTIDLKYKLGCTPSWWQLFKALHEIGHEVIITPYLGDPIESLWWKTYPNPCSWESKVYNTFLEYKKRHGKLPKYNEKTNAIINKFAEIYVHGKWDKHLRNILEREKNIDAVLFVNIPLNQIQGLPLEIQKIYGIPVGYLDGDMPTILPQYAVKRGFKFNYYIDADLSEFTAFFTNSKGVIPDLKQLGAKNVIPLYYAIDPEFFQPISLAKDIDISFFGYGNEYREKWMNELITIPSKKIKDINFVVGGKGFNIDIGNAKFIGDLSYSAFREFCCRSKICLNITRWSHTKVYASSTARIFELAGYGACIVTQPYNGIEEWFKPGRELIVVNNNVEAINIYKYLLDHEEERQQIAKKARKKVLEKHTFKNRAKTIINNLT